MVAPSIPGIAGVNFTPLNYSPATNKSEQSKPGNLSGGYTPAYGVDKSPAPNYTPISGGAAYAPPPSPAPKPEASVERPVLPLPNADVSSINLNPTVSPKPVSTPPVQTLDVLTIGGIRYSVPKGTSEEQFYKNINQQSSNISSAIYSTQKAESGQLGSNPERISIRKDVTVGNISESPLHVSDNLKEPIFLTRTPSSEFAKVSENKYEQLPTEAQYKKLTEGSPLASNMAYESYGTFASRAVEEARAGKLTTVNLQELRSIGREELATDRVAAIKAELTGGKLNVLQNIGRIVFTGFETIPSEATAIGSELLGNRQFAADIRENALNREALQIAKIQIASESKDYGSLISKAAFETPVGLVVTSYGSGVVLGAGLETLGLGIKAASLGTKAEPLVTAATPYAGKALLGAGVVLTGLEGLRLKDVYETAPLTLPTELTKTGVGLGGFVVGYPKGSVATKEFLTSPAPEEVGVIKLKQTIGGLPLVEGANPEVVLKKVGTETITYPRTRIQKFLDKEPITEVIKIQKEQFRPASSLFAQEGEASLEAGKKLTDMIVVEPGVNGVKGLRGVKASDFAIGETREAVRVEGIEAFKGMASGKDIGKLNIEAQSSIKLEIPKPSSSLGIKEVKGISKLPEFPKMITNEAYLNEAESYNSYLRGGKIDLVPSPIRFPAGRFGTGRAELGDLITLEKLGKFDMSSPKISASISDTTPSIKSAVEKYRTGYDKIYSTSGTETIGASSKFASGSLIGLRPTPPPPQFSGGRMLATEESKIKLKTDSIQGIKTLAKELTITSPRFNTLSREDVGLKPRQTELPATRVIPATDLRQEQRINLRQETRLREEYRLHEDFRSGGGGITPFGGGGFSGGGGGSHGSPARLGGFGKLASLRGGTIKYGKPTVGLLSEGFSKALFGKSTFQKSYKGSREIVSPSKELTSRGLTFGKIFGLGGVTAKKAFKRNKK